jgi:hypothetical protein
MGKTGIAISRTNKHDASDFQGTLLSGFLSCVKMLVREEGFLVVGLV